MRHEYYYHMWAVTATVQVEGILSLQSFDQIHNFPLSDTFCAFIRMTIVVVVFFFLV